MNNLGQCIVTGGAGFIGSHLCNSLLNQGLELFCVDNLLTGSKNNIQHLLSNVKFHFINHDITKSLPFGVIKQLHNLKYIYHLASPASPSQYRKYSIQTLLVNSIGTYIVLELARKFHSDFLITSTSEVYGDPLIHPQAEDYWGNVNPVGVRACYDEGKRFAEALTMEYVRKYQLKARIIRIFNTYGPRMQVEDGRVVSNFINQALKRKPLTIYGDGHQTRSFCYVSDMVRGLLLAMESEEAIGQVINLGHPEEYTIEDIAQTIRKLASTSSEIKYLEKQEDDPQRRNPVIAKAKEILNWQPQISFVEGLKKTIDYFRHI